MHYRDFTEEQYHALQLELEDKERVIADLKKKADEQVKSEKELRKLRDNMDIMKEKVAAAAKTEEKFSRLQGKLEELAELKAQYKVPPPSTTITQVNMYTSSLSITPPDSSRAK